MFGECVHVGTMTAVLYAIWLKGAPWHAAAQVAKSPPKVAKSLGPLKRRRLDNKAREAIVEEIELERRIFDFEAPSQIAATGSRSEIL